MAGQRREPSYRDLDFYHLVKLRLWKQKNVANSFGVEPSRVSQVVRRVREWVDDRVGAWLFPGRHDLRFLAALDKHQIRIREGENPQHVVIEGGNGSLIYTRTITVTLPGAATPTAGSTPVDDSAGTKLGAQLGANVSPQSLTFVEPLELAVPSAMPAAAITSATSAGV